MRSWLDRLSRDGMTATLQRGDECGILLLQDSRLSRREMLRASTVLAAGAVFAEPLAAAAPEPTPLSPAMIQAARKEGTLAFYTAMEIPVAEGLRKAFEAKYPGIEGRVRRSGAEREFQRIDKEE